MFSAICYALPCFSGILANCLWFVIWRGTLSKVRFWESPQPKSQIPLFHLKHMFSHNLICFVCFYAVNCDLWFGEGDPFKSDVLWASPPQIAKHTLSTKCTLFCFSYVFKQLLYFSKILRNQLWVMIGSETLVTVKFWEGPPQNHKLYVILCT